GPFVCRNHFPFYTNVCLGLAVGLLLGAIGFGRSTSWQDTLAGLGRHPAALWLGLALALMVAANLYSLSRGGVVALVGGALVWGLAALARRPAGLAVVAAAAVIGLGLVGWLGGDEVGRRLATLWGNDLLAEGRGTVWARTLPLVGRFPVWGAGYGTFE